MSLKSCCGKSSDLSSTTQESQKIDESILNKINQILQIVIEENKNLKNYSEKLKSQKKMPFNSNFIPSISPKKYIDRIAKYTEVEESTLIIALIYIDRICEMAKIILTPFNIHRIIFTSILLAIKYNEDIVFDFEFYAQVAGIPVKELKILEIEFSVLLKFKFFVNNRVFENYKLYIDDIEDDENNK